MIDEPRRMRERCEPKSNQNPRYLRYSNAVSALLWIIDDLAEGISMQMLPGIPFLRPLSAIGG